MKTSCTREGEENERRKKKTVKRQRRKRRGRRDVLPIDCGVYSMHKKKRRGKGNAKKEKKNACMCKRDARTQYIQGVRRTMPKEVQYASYNRDEGGKRGPTKKRRRTDDRTTKQREGAVEKKSRQASNRRAASNKQRRIFGEKSA